MRTSRFLCRVQVFDEGRCTDSHGRLVVSEESFSAA